MKVTLTVHGKEHDGKQFVFTEPGSLLFGRSKRAQCRIERDGYVSRDHFLLLINPPDVRLRNISATNGTEVDGALYTCGEIEDDPEAGTLRKDDTPEVEEAVLHDGSEIEVGYTRLTVAIEEDERCEVCGRPVPDSKRRKARDGGRVICDACQEEEEKAGKKRQEEERKRRELEKKRQTQEEALEEERGRKRRKVELLVERGNRLLERGKGPQALEVFGQAHELDQHNKEVVRGLKRARDLARSREKPPSSRGRSDDLLDVILTAFGMRQPKGKIPNIPGYKIVREIEKGGMGVVFEAEKLDEGRRVAIKVIIPERPVTEEARKRFRREMKIAQSLSHPHIVEFIDCGVTHGLPWLVLDFVEKGWHVGREADKRRGRIELDDALEWTLQSLDALAYAHNKGVIHRDIKPPNIMLKRDGRKYVAQVIDFGLAKSLEDAQLNGSIITMPGLFMGTVPYMPPEQVVDVRTATRPADVFAMAATFYHIATGRVIRDFVRNQNAVIRQMVQERAVPIRERDRSIPRGVAKVIDKALSLDPNARYKDASALKAALERQR